ncbi:guanylate cyclase [Pseudonocardia sp. EC080610-09]|uniref:adenylate/guanylate cyclase domain-containing protein n=1 Tax=unclassified Pseudonocardia TaxID=2619320 RepID=UPI0006CB0461|nr:MULTISPECIES: adenylate/guanylate cyclase domain-containing protein [unclassified Pseudonocardia]ALE75712.1 guanylate cyclase [Pseudonocardia sp. EC080625-04]ALL75094.1 guanylate cyclase [Pseudonocardia sp. EC080610-09]ALL82116.1 guanylate cyclase [Pseudonocardia sp. EC080619-01]
MTNERPTRPGRPVVGLSVRALIALVVVTANVGGAAVVLVIAAFVLPREQLLDAAGIRLVNLAVLGGYLLVAIPIGIFFGRRALTVRRRASDPERTERRLVLHGPARITSAIALLWFLAAVLFCLLNLRYSGRLAFSVTSAVAIGGVTTCALSFLLVERMLRRAAARVLSGRPPRRRRLVTGVMLRSVGFWALGTAVPLAGVMLAGLVALVFGDASPTQLAVTMLALGGTAIGTGLLTTIGAARAIADPVLTVRRALARVQDGDLDVRVPVYDNTELGQLQAGANQMVEGLRERERIRDLFGRHVGRDVAEAAAATDGGVRLGGEVRPVAVLFVDLVGSTSMAARRPPEEVVALLNRFFGVVVECVESSGGWINKFEGDAALAIFGAPIDLDDAPGAALAAARCLSDRLADEMPDVEAGIGVSAGDAVAGNLGDPRRYEYTVIGDPVNEAARLTELAKSVPGRVAASSRAVDATGAEARRWRSVETVTLRGRDEPTGIWVPVEHTEAPQEEPVPAGDTD